MDLILWRHAEAHLLKEGQSDLERGLTSKGERQAARMADWLSQRLAQGTKVLVSPALRCQQTAKALGKNFKTLDALAPDASGEALLQAARWPESPDPVLVIGHQPMLGQTVAQLLGLAEGECSVRKGAVWWLRHRERQGESQTVVVTVQVPELL